MAFGARQENGAWRICLRKGAAILHLDSKAFPGVEVKFKSQAKAKACADTLNEVYWKRYEKARNERWTSTYGWVWEMAELVYDMGGISDADWKRITTK
ncbi:hypothetical protein [Mesorhizobium sp.]|uniref:hypothetical protein n=1 Tax=Mesorhizobium sp. TaxID=1871066 RepID=UPI000FE8650C|nr:hypothetical protein [Mesorhizobium sp.]RWI35501.1 MAG: hypothetical protein EOR14_28780 [Mesorhizobium sp.]RWJ66330.1 MAG: hypothetical protein EOR34_28355 [Mesorhizobium sp.]